MDLDTFVSDFAGAMMATDSRRPQASSHRSGRLYQPGIGPLPEDKVVDLIVEELRSLHVDRYAAIRTRIPYPFSKQKCDLALGNPPEWTIEIKMARLSGDNGKPDDTSIKDILSPYERDRSAISDCLKLMGAGFSGRSAMLIYGFDDARRPLDHIVDAFEILARTRVSLGARKVGRLAGLIHPIFRSGWVFAWEIGSL